MKTILILNDNIVELDELQDVDGNFINNATCTFTLRDEADTADVQASTAMTYVTSSNGKYRGVLADTTALVDGVVYRVQITATGPASERGFWNEPVVAKNRRSSS